MCEVRHEICIKNLYDNEIITNEIIIINGVVTSRCHHSEITLYEKNSNAKFKSIISTRTGEFKILCQLIPGNNHFRLMYCDHCREIECNFIESDTEYKIQPLYIVCKEHDKYTNSSHATIDEAQKKINLALKLVQCLYAEKLLKSANNKRSTFSINSDCVPFYSELHTEKARNLSEHELWSIFASEILKSNYGENKKLKFVAFIGCTLYEGITNNDYSYENIKNHTKATAQLGGGGLALFGTGCLYAWPSSFNEIISCFEDNKKINLKKYLDDSNYRRTYGGCFATTLGAMCHEIGHIFDLGHTESGIMGNDFDYINHVFIINDSKLTEYLPNRIIKDKVDVKKDNRLTKIKNLTNNSFLQKYHEQKNGCTLTYFPLNCLLILKFHKWINDDVSWLNDDNQIVLDEDTFTIRSIKSYLRLIEIRTKLNALVIQYFDLTQQNALSFSILRNFKCNKSNFAFNIFAITADGTSRLFDV